MRTWSMYMRIRNMESYIRNVKMHIRNKIYIYIYIYTMRIQNMLSIRNTMGIWNMIHPQYVYMHPECVYVYLEFVGVRGFPLWDISSLGVMGMGPGLFQIFVVVVFFRAPLSILEKYKKYTKELGNAYVNNICRHSKIVW